MLITSNYSGLHKAKSRVKPHKHTLVPSIPSQPTLCQHIRQQGLVKADLRPQLKPACSHTARSGNILYSKATKRELGKN
jgi:hypothetical protein